MIIKLLNPEICDLKTCEIHKMHDANFWVIYIYPDILYYNGVMCASLPAAKALVTRELKEYKFKKVRAKWAKIS